MWDGENNTYWSLKLNVHRFFMYLSLVVLEFCSWHLVFITCTKLRMDQLRAKLMVGTINFYLKKKINADIVRSRLSKWQTVALLPLFVFIFIIFWSNVLWGILLLVIMWHVKNEQARNLLPASPIKGLTNHDDRTLVSWATSYKES